MLKIKQAELKQALEDGLARLKRVEAWLAQFEQEDNMPEIEVSVKRVEPFKVAAIRATAPTRPAMLGVLHEVAEATVICDPGRVIGRLSVFVCATTDHGQLTTLCIAIDLPSPLRYAIIRRS